MMEGWAVLVCTSITTRKASAATASVKKRMSAIANQAFLIFEGGGDCREHEEAEHFDRLTSH
jgi:hypothetical protein